MTDGVVLFVFFVIMQVQYNMQWLTEAFDKGDNLKFIFFWGHTPKANETIGNFCFSQWYNSPFAVGGITYRTAEHWMMAQKALLFEDTNTYNAIIKAHKPGEAKELGRQVLGFNEIVWERKRYEIVTLGSIHKFNQHPTMAEYLLNTGDRVLVEASPVDTIWGIGLPPDSEQLHNIYNWRGLNLLGFALMEARDFLKKFGHFTTVNTVMPAPWIKFPGVDSRDIFWRMGKGEEYLIDFYKSYEALSEREKMIYRLTNPAPYNWQEVYD